MIVKICGITNLEDARAAISAGANALGFNFYPNSPRYIGYEAARSLIAKLPGDIVRAGVYVNEAPVDEAVALGLDVLQVYGGALARPGARLWRAVNVTAGFGEAMLADTDAEAFVLDAPAGPQHGGTGRTFDWERARGLRRRIIVAGGLDATNVARAIEMARPWGVDACSRIERAPGRKDHEKMAAFIEAALRAI